MNGEPAKAWSTDPERITDIALNMLISGYKAMSKGEHSIHSRAVMACLIELQERRALSAGE